MSEKISRRRFLDASGRTVTGLAAGLAVGGLTRTARAQANANEKLIVALIGCGGMGNHKMHNFMESPDVEIAALCDVDDRQIANKNMVETVEKKYARKPAVYKDYRKLLDRKDIDAVIVATPDHWHAICMIAACQAGKDVYVEKPCSHNVAEGQAMIRAATKYNRIVQVGMHQRSAECFQKGVQLVQSGALGDIAYTRTWKVQNHSPDGIGTPPDAEPPAELDYDMWLGPAPKRPYNENRCHYTFRWFYDYAGGLLGDWNVHLQDIVHWAMGTYDPISVSATGGKYVLKDNRETPDTLDVAYEFQTPGGKKFTQIFTYTFGCATPLSGIDYGIQFFGTNGSFFINREYWETFPDTKGAPDPNDPKKKIRVPRMDKLQGKGLDSHVAHALNFIACVKSRKAEDLNTPIEVGHKTAAACHLGNVSYRVGRKLYWDAKKETCTDKDGHPDKEANQLLTREYRKPYVLPEV